MRRLRLTAFAASLVLHAVVVVPLLVGREPLVEDDTPVFEVDALEGDDADGELPIEELENAAFRVTLYTEPAPTPVATAEDAAVTAEAAAPAVEAPPPPEAPPEEAEVAIALPVPEPPPPEPPAPEPPADVVAELPVEPLPEPPLSEADRAALAEMERGDAVADLAPIDDDDGEAHEAPAGTRRGSGLFRARSKGQRKEPTRKPCPPAVTDIARVAELHWYIDRDLIERYATNIPELKKLGSVWTYKNAAGKVDGFKVGLSRCSVLRQGGLRSGDIVHDINGRRIATVLQAVGAYLALRSEPELKVRITRRGEPVVLSYTIEQPQRKGGKKKKVATAER